MLLRRGLLVTRGPLLSLASNWTPQRPRAARTSVSSSMADPSPAASKKVKMAICQLLVTADKEENIKCARKAIEDAAKQGSSIVVLPEMWNCPYSNDSFPTYAEEVPSPGPDSPVAPATSTSPSVSMMADVSRQCGVTLVGGSIPECSNGKLYNTCCVFGSRGSLLGKHRKTHLFDIDIPGKIRFMESDTLTAGDKLTVVDTDVGRLGIGICYDIRFPEMALLYAKAGVQIIVYPGAFNTTTGPAHWEVVQRARAVDCQLFVVTCSPARQEGAGYQAWGHSTAVGPFGEVLATCGHEQATVFVELDLAQVERRRENMPFMRQRRADLYSLTGEAAKP
ncbi:unnamed protein product [Ostreobium quekettii]|uniref:CN hydrolase domain-containing protein n=1 Tax=Ostreobium quekettii TaxID=121088 RepID=A0A8S1J153_9CHLO|nr:unnamed protein product [Ostreobium quekettii]|eukprot:evm.model.scf_1107EXC.2 EVM.evm.TU.scf_1107EXC.2   scf_1107EXC:17767-22217(+)